ncbi:MAG: haloacid dehalogenase-like hydrolase [Clostridiales bacterium]|nr:haloacid dehalogenase-like hydrolase [Clostridiales bacterium]
MKADLYDFDKTVYDGDSGMDFWKYCLKRKPSIIIYLPYQILCAVKYYLKIGDQNRNKEALFCYFPKINAEEYARDFWRKNRHKIFSFFLPENRENPAVICSASPEFFLKIICDELKVDTLIGTVVDPQTGKLLSENCRREEKVRRIKKTLPKYEFVNVFSDSIKNDMPILTLGENAFHTVKGDPVKVDLK